ncbi:hypothetical protein H2203_005284 [Taxawa tesnikishii (nom. ined.)]|nr:hypothetical protein H2203_005284 [Dothideales sp. JES 119]
MAMDGIFFDEAPYEYSAEAAAYMDTVDEAAKNSSGLQGNRTVIHNPGTVPSTLFNLSTTDITVVFEDAYYAYWSQLSSLSSLPLARTHYSQIIHSIPAKKDSSGDLQHLVDQMSQHAAYLFLTVRSMDPYEGFAANWTKFIDVMPS